MHSIATFSCFPINIKKKRIVVETTKGQGQVWQTQRKYFFSRAYGKTNEVKIKCTRVLRLLHFCLWGEGTGREGAARDSCELSTAAWL
jgi:hypothetical protein